MANLKISLADFNTILLHAEKISNGQLDFISVLRGELKSKLDVEDAEPLIDSLKNGAADVHNLTRLFLVQFNFIIEGENVNYRLVKFNDNRCELEPIKTDNNNTPQKFYRYFLKSSRPIFGSCPSGYVNANKTPVVIRGITKFFASVYYKAPLTDKDILNYDLEPDINNPVNFDTPPDYNRYKNKKQSAKNAAPVEDTTIADGDTLSTDTATETKKLALFGTATPATTLEQRVIKIQFHLQNMGQSAIIIGQELIECKKEIPHGDWINWLKTNFNMSQRTAYNFMNIAERFSNLSISQNLQTSANLNLLTISQLTELLLLPKGDEEKFIAEKAAEGNPVENMTIKQEREEIKKYKAKIEQLDKDNQKLADINHNLRRNLDASSREMLDIEEQNQKLQDENKQLTSINHTLRLENEALKDQEPQVIETVKTITPPDYVATIQRAENLQQQVDQLLEHNEQAQKTIDDLQEQVLEAVSKQGEIQIEYVEKETVDAEIKRRKEQHVFEELKQFYDIAHFLFHNLDTVKNLKSRFRDGGLSHFDTGNSQIDQVLKVLITNVEAVNNEIYGNKNK